MQDVYHLSAPEAGMQAVYHLSAPEAGMQAVYHLMKFWSFSGTGCNKKIASAVDCISRGALIGDGRCFTASGSVCAVTF